MKEQSWFHMQKRSRTKSMGKVGSIYVHCYRNVPSNSMLGRRTHPHSSSESGECNSASAHDKWYGWSMTVLALMCALGFRVIQQRQCFWPWLNQPKYKNSHWIPSAILVLRSIKQTIYQMPNYTELIFYSSAQEEKEDIFQFIKCNSLHLLVKNSSCLLDDAEQIVRFHLSATTNSV